MEIENSLKCINMKDCTMDRPPVQQPTTIGAGDRIIYITGEITDQTAGAVITEILNINKYDRYMKRIYGKKYKIRPIKMYINTYGGDCVHGLSIIDAMNNSKAPIYTIATGECLSMGVLIFLNGVKRFATKHISFMIHGVASFGGGKLPDIDESVEHMKHVEDLLFNMILEKTKIKKSKLEKVFKKERCNWWFYYDEAKELGLITDELENIDKKPKKKK